ncbi:MAG TPA: nicotinate phosphoribosyltransferase [Clostridiales bacterium]|jgi:nicotinate phosphoribosyltransferase|nr:nicotinate phosphoribosyltransferase [Clostridiales bacterium]
MNGDNLTMLTDFYELTMANGYHVSGVGEQIAYFDLFYRKVPEGGGLAIMAGLDSLIDYLTDLSFSDSDIAYLREHGFDEGFLDYLKNFRFACDVWAVPEGTPIFPGEPIVTVRGPIVQAQFIETMALLLINHQSLIATKASRIVRAAEGREVVEFGARRAHGASASVLGARAAYIAGCIGTSCTIVEQRYGIPVSGTMAHSWVQLFDSEYEAFDRYAQLYPNQCTLLVDTYDVLRSGIPNAIRAFDRYAPEKKGIRIDSGDITYLSKNARKMLDDAGHADCKIVVSNSLDEYLIRNMLLQGACVDSFGVGERLITAKAEPVFGGVYKLVASERNGEVIPKIKVSENVEKITNPGFKKVYRLYDKDSGQAFADVIALADEPVPAGNGYPIVDPHSAKRFKKLDNFEARELLVPIFERGRLVYERPAISDIRAHCLRNISEMWEETLRFDNPHRYYVDLSIPLWELKTRMLEESV